jgi:hypothetical protein
MAASRGEDDMHRGLVMIGALIGGGLLAAFASPVAPATSFDIWGTGPDILTYNRLMGTCETVTHAFGRNAAWGRWEMPLAQVDVTIAPAATDEGAKMTFTCRDGADCIRAGALDRTPNRVAIHAVRFGSMERALELEGAISRLRGACAAA